MLDHVVGKGDSLNGDCNLSWCVLFDSDKIL